MLILLHRSLLHVLSDRHIASLPYQAILDGWIRYTACLADYVCNLSVVDPLLLDQDPQHPGIEMLVFARQVWRCTCRTA